MRQVGEIDDARGARTAGRQLRQGQTARLMACLLLGYIALPAQLSAQDGAGAPATKQAPGAAKDPARTPGMAGATAAPAAPAAPSPAGEAPSLSNPPPPGSAGSLQTPPKPADTANAQQFRLSLSASLSSSPGKPIAGGLLWRIYPDTPEAGEAIARPVVETTDATPVLQLRPSVYVAHVSFGYASAMRRIDLHSDSQAQLAINAGGLKVMGSVGDVPIPTSQMRVSVYVPVGQDLEGRQVIDSAPPGVVFRLPEGMYHVVSTFGDSNAVMRADLRVEPGKVTEATLHHRAATVTLKLVQAPGGEAFAGTAFSVLTPGGDVIREEIGAFPSLVLAEGDYVVIARHDGKVHTREFKVESGVNRDIEVLATQ